MELRAGEDAPHCRALLAGFLRDVAHHVGDEEVPTRAAWRHVGSEHGGVQAVRRDVQARAAPRELLPQPRRRLRGAGEGDHVLRPKPIEQIAGAPGKKAERARRERSRLDAQLGEAEGDEGGAGRRLP